MRRLLRVLAGALFVAGCSGEVAPAGEPDAGATCVDRDHDGFGQNCALGSDCDDHNPNSTIECRSCAHPDLGCPCDKGQEPISCFAHDQPLPDGNVMCREGTRVCRDGRWSACEDMHGYVVTPDRSLTGLVNPDAAPENCSICDISCFKVRDPLLTADGGVTGGLSYSSGGGLTISAADGGGGTMGEGGMGEGGTTLMGCAGLMACCTTLTGQQTSGLKGQCDTTAAGGNDAECNAALQLFCPSVIGGPVGGCTIGKNSSDTDCDGIPDVLDECTPATIATNPACNGTTLPLTTTNNQTIFHILDKGETGSNSLEVGFKVQNADVYFLMDTSDTMDKERDQLVSSLTGCPVGQPNCANPSINVVECALLKNCCDKLSGTTQTACNNVVNGDNTTNCKNAEANYCTGNAASLVHCPDLNFDGLPDDNLKSQGVVGAVRCLVGSAWFGAGYFRELPFGGQNLGDKDEHAFRHWVDMTPDVNRVRDAISHFQTNGNSDYPEADMVALYSLLSGKGAPFGNQSPSIPERVGLGCPAESFGYPCFRKGTIPIVVLFTDDPMHNGPTTYGGGGTANNLAYSALYAPNGYVPSAGKVRYTPVEVETFAHPFNFGSINGQFAIASGSLQYMAGDYPAAITGCGAATAAPDAVYTFKVDPLLSALGLPIGTPVTVKVGINTVLDGDSLAGAGPTPVTDQPVVVSLYRGVPSGIPSGRTHLTDSTIYSIPSGPDLAYLMYDGTTAGGGSKTGLLGGISGCGADGKTNEVAFTFRPTVNAKVVIDSSGTSSVAGGFDSVISLHEGLPGALPANPSGGNYVPLVGASNNNDTFTTARSVNVGGKIDGAYVTYVGDTQALTDTGSGSIYNVPSGRTNKDDYDDNVVACGVNPVGVDAVYKFDVQTARRVRIDTEGSKFQTVISLHDRPPPQAYLETDITGNSTALTSKSVGTMSGDSVSNALYTERSDNHGTTDLDNNIAPVCGGVATGNAKEAYYRFNLTTPTHLSVSAPPRRFIAAAGQAYNTPGAANEAVSTNPPPNVPHAEPVINEFVVSHTGGDTKEYVEIFGQPNTDYSASYKILQIEGDHESNEGAVTKLISVGATNASGLWVSPYLNGALQNGTGTLLLVKDYTGNASSDIDMENDGVVDLPALWSSVVDAVAVSDGDSGDIVYAGAVALTANFDGVGSVVGGASRIPNGRDTDSASDWVRNDFAGDGLPGFGFEPMVFLYSSPPGTVTSFNAADPNGDMNISDSNTHNNAVSALDLGDVFGQVDTKINNADLGDAHTTNDYSRGVVSCNGYAVNIQSISTNTLTFASAPAVMPVVGDIIIKGGTAKIVTVNSSTSVVMDNATVLSTGNGMLYQGSEPPGFKEHVYKFTPTGDGTVRINTATLGAYYQAVAIYDGPPPINGAIGSVQLFDASKLSAPDTGCTAWSYDANKADGVPAHVYWFCNASRNWSTAEGKCNGGGGHLVRLDNAAENTFVANNRTGTPAWTAGHDAGGNNWQWADNNNQFWSGGKTGSAVGGLFTSWRSGMPATSGYCVEYAKTGGDNANWDAVSCTANAQFVCEYNSPATPAPESLVSAYPVGQEVGLNGNMVGKVLSYAGSTRRMDIDFDGSAMSPCGAAAGAPDAVFKITPGGTLPVQITIDTSGSAFPAIVGLYHTDASGYLGCDAAGAQPNTNVTNSANAGPLPLSATLSAGETYYAVIKGTAAAPDGAYQIKFTDTNAGGDGIELACSKQTATTAAAAEADFSANHTYYVIVESAGPGGDKYDMTAHSLYRRRVQTENPLAQNEHGGTALAVADPYRSKVQVVNTSTAGMAANYAVQADTPGALLTCGGSSAAPDAVYKFTPTIDTKVRVAVNMPNKNAIVALFKGQPGSFPTTTNVPNTNEGTQSAYQVNLNGPAQTLLGDTSMMSNDIDGTLLSCGASPTGADAVFRFSLSKQTNVQIDASASTGAGKMGDPVIALFHDYALEKPVATTLENDSYTDADAHPSPTPVASDAWLSYKGDMANMTPATQALMSASTDNMNEVVNPTTLMGAQDLGDIWNTKVTIGGGDTTAMAADYSASGWCGGDDNAPDAIYSFHSSQAGPVHISTAKPAPGFNTVLTLYDGTNGAPLRKVDSATTTVDLSMAAGCGDGILNWDEQCDDGNATLGDGCEGCMVVSGIWRCPAAWRGGHDGCDCGCGAVDPDCVDATSASCAKCYTMDVGGCGNTFACPGRIDPNNNALCRASVCGDGIVEAGEQCDDGNAIATDGCDACAWAPGVWHCDAGSYGTGDGCDCGCGIFDPDCANATAGVCDNCGDDGACNFGSCPGAINPTNNAVCTTYGGGSNPNDTINDAIGVNLAAGGWREYLGNTALTKHDIPASQIQCGATATAPDAIYSFSLRKTTQVQIDASSMLPNKPVIALFNSAALGTPPQSIALENDEPAQADLNPAPTPKIGGNWVIYSGDIADLSNSSQPQTSINNQDNVNNDTWTELPDPINRRDTVANADTSAVTAQATYPAPSCGGSDTSHDALYRFVPSQSQTVRISTKYPSTMFSSVVALYDGTDGMPPLTRAQQSITTTAIDQSHESQDSAMRVPIGAGGTYVDTGSTTGMTSDVPSAYYKEGALACGAAPNAPDTLFSFSLSKPTDVEISAQGSAYGTVLGLFDSPFVRPSTTSLSPLVDSITQLYDPDKLPSQPEAGCTPYDYNLHRYWFCSTKRPWDDARAKCLMANLDLAVIDDQLENDTMFAQVSATGESHLIGLRAHTPYTSWGSAPYGDWVDGSNSTFRNWLTGEPSQPTANAGARMRSQDGVWLSVPSSFQPFRYICEQTNQNALPQPPTATTPQDVDIFGASRHFVGSTVGAPNSVGNLIGCSAQATAPDAVFKLVVKYTSNVTLAFGSSFAGSVVGVFKGSIGAVGYSDAGSTCAPVTASSPQLSLTNLAPATYYVVLTGTSAGLTGKYDVLFSGTTTDPAAFTMENDRLADAVSNPIGDITNRWVVKRADMAHLGTDLITARTVDMQHLQSNTSHQSPFQVKDLGSTTGEQVSVINATILNDANHDYAAATCGGDSDSADQIFKFTPTKSTPVRISVAPSGGWNPIVSLYRGPDFPLLRSQVPLAPITLATPNTNDAPTTSGGSAAQDLGVIADPIVYIGNIATLANASPNVPTIDAAGRTWDRSDVNGGDASNMCNASPTGKDAFFSFTLTGTKSVVLQTAQTAFAHTLAVWKSTDQFVAPTAVTAEYEKRSDAPNMPIDGQWYSLQGNTTNLMPGADTKVTKVAGTDFSNTTAIQNLGTLSANTQIVTSGADSASTSATYDNATLTCGAAPSAHDMIFKFHTGASGGPTRISVNNPSPTFPPVLALFDGSGGKVPQTAAAATPTPTGITNNNDTRANAYHVPNLSTVATAYSGDTSMLPTDGQTAALYNQAPIYGTNTCSAGGGTKDAFFEFTLPVDATVRIQPQASTAFDHTIAIYDKSVPITAPAATALQYNNYALANAATVAMDKNWVVYSADMSPAAGMSIGELGGERFFVAGTDFQNAAGVQDLNAVAGTINGKQFRTKAASSYAGGADTTYTGNSYLAPCAGGNDSANDMIWKVRPTTSTKLRFAINNPGLSGFSPQLAIYDGSPLTAAEIATITYDENALSPANPNETFATAKALTVGSRATVLGNEASMASNYASTQFQAFQLGAAPKCSPKQPGADAFVRVDVRTVPDAVQSYTQVWLDAADASAFSPAALGAVTTWNDESTKAHHVTQSTAANQPSRQLASGAYSVRFNGSGDTDSADNTTEDYLDYGYGTGQDSPVSVFAVWKLVNTSFLASAAVLRTDVPSGGIGFALRMSADGAGGTSALIYRDSSNVDVAMTDAFAAGSGVMLSEVTHDATGAINTYLNGNAFASGAGRVGGTQYQHFLVGANNNHSRGLPMDLYELIVVSRAVSQSERQTIEGYLAAKWGLQASLPAGHPYVSAAPTRNVEISSSLTAFGHTMALFNAIPMTKPAAVAGSAYDTSDLAVQPANRMGAIDSTWLVRSASTAGMHIDDLVQVAGTAAADGATQNLGVLNGNEITVSGGSATTASYAGDYPLTCGSSNGAPDAIYLLTASETTHARIGLRNPNFNGDIALYESPESSPTAPPLTNGVLGLSAAETNLTATNETMALARTVTFPSSPSGGAFTGYAAGFTGDPNTADVAGTAFQDPSDTSSCNPDTSASGQDAFFSFTVPAGPQREIEISAQGTGGEHVLALFSQDPGQPDKPQVSAGSFASNIDTTAIDFTGAPSWVCSGGNTTVYSGSDSNGTGAGITATSCTGGAATAVVMSQTTGGPKVVVVKLSSLSVSAGHTMNLRGALPVVFLVNGAATLGGGSGTTTINADSQGNGSTVLGAGGNFSSCGTSVGQPGIVDAAADQGSGGGSGGAFRTAGQPGGKGDNTTTGLGGAASTATTTSAASSLKPLRGGCSAGNGANSANSGGAGGGAFQISARTTLTLNTGIALSAAGGGGQKGGGQEDGGGGGGSGGAILLEGGTITQNVAFTSVAYATGGGGASGHQTDATNGVVGQDGQRSTAQATGGTGTDGAGSGGKGGAAVGTATAGANGSLGFAPSNVAASYADFTASPTWSCTASGTTTINSTNGTATSTSCALGTLDILNGTSNAGVAQLDSSGPNVMIVRLKALTITNNHLFTLTGNKPIVFLVGGNVLIDSGGKIDAGAAGATAGPGGSIAAQCTGQTGGNGTVQSDGGGGGGGGFGTAGGKGGAGSNNSSTQGAAGGTSSNTNLMPLRGGCSGGHGADDHGTIGAGGGAFQISASGTVTIGTGTNTATLNANGGFGSGQPNNSGCNGDGGNGGGSGGGILIEAQTTPTVGTNGVLRTNGGGGGGGTECGNSDSGQDGHDTDDNQATGGRGDAISGDGGKGGLCKGSGCATSAVGAVGQNAAGGAGGGGGGGGRIRVVAAATSKRGAGGGGGGGGQGYLVSRTIDSSAVFEKDTAALALGAAFAASDSTWTVKGADFANLSNEWAVASSLSESSYSGTGESADAPLTLPTPTGAKLTIDGNNATRASDYDINVCGVDAGKDTVYKFTPTTTGKLRIKVSGRTGTAISNPIVAVYDRYFGNGYFHGCSLQACVTDNNSDTSLPGAQGLTDTDATAGTTTITDLSVTAGNAYYLVVKSGGSSIVNGAYNLELTWKDPDDWASCSEDTYDGKDGWFAFTTAASLASGGTYTIETQNSTADTTIALYKDANSDNAYQAGEYLTCGNEVNGAASITTTLLPSTKYYVRVKQTVGGASGNIVLGIRNSAVVVNTNPLALACADSGSSLGYAKIVEALDPGTYYVGWRGGRGSTHYTGSYHVSFRDNTNLPAAASSVGCAVATSGGSASLEATLEAGRNYYVLVKGDGASSNSGTYSLNVADTGAVPSITCSGKSADPGAPDAFEAFSVTGTKDVTVDLSGSTLDGVYQVWQDNGASDTYLGCGVTTGGTTTVTKQLAPGNYYVKVRGTDSSGSAGEQPFQVSVRDDDVQRAVDCSDGASTTGATMTKTLTAGQYYVGLKPTTTASAGSYQLTVRDPSFNSTGGTQSACTTTKTADVNVTANHDYYVLVKGTSPSDKGQYGLTITDIGALDTTASSYDTRTDIGCGTDLSAPDAYYSFTVATVPKRIEVSLGGGFSGAYQLYRDDGTFTADDTILGCATGTQIYNITTAGKYFLVAKGLSTANGAAEGPMQVQIRDLDAIGSIACANGTAATPAVLQTSSMPSGVLNAGKLKAGTYVVAFTGQGASNGAYALQFNDQDQISTVNAPVMQCTNALAMTQNLAANTDYYAIVKGDGPPNQGPFTLAITDVSGVKAIDASCPTDLAAPDGYAAFTLSSATPHDIRVDMSASTLTGAFQVFDNSGNAVAGCGCSSIATAKTCTLPGGGATYYVVYRGDNLAAGLAQRPFKMQIQDLSGLGSIACADGPANTGATVTTPPLGAGTYYVGIIPNKTNTATDFSYRLSVKDSASVAVTGAPEIGCSASSIDANVNANEPYYVVVKGKNSSDSGDFGMTVQDLSGVPSFGCGDDTTSGDAFYSFTITRPGGSNVTIDSQGSTLQTVVALFPSTANFGTDVRNNTTRVCCNPTDAGQPTGACNLVASCDGKPDDLVACDSNSGPSMTSLINGVHLAPGTYYLVVRARAGAPGNKLPFTVSVREDDGVPSTYCSATTDVTNGQATIHHVLQPGTYWAALTGSSSLSPTSGNYSVRFRDYAPVAKAATQIACDTASDTIVQSVTAGKPYYVVVKGDTSGAQGKYKLTVENAQAATTMGCNADPDSPDAFYRFSLSAPTQVTIDTTGSTLDTVIALYNVGVSYFGTNYAADTSGNIVSCDDDGAGSGGASRIARTLPAGDYYVEVRGKTGTGATWGNTSKPYKISIRDTTASANIACAPSSAPTLTFGSSNPLPAGDYKLVVSDDGAGGSYDIRFKDLSVGASAATKVACDTANDTIDYTVAANKQYYVIVKGDGAASAKGGYGLTVQSAGGGASMGCGADPTAGDAFFKFNVTKQTDVTIDTVGSALDTVLAIYPGNATVFGTNYAKDAFNQPTSCDDNGGGGTSSMISATLATGTYYAVVKGKSATWGNSALPFNLSIRDDGSTRAITCANAGSGAQITQTLPAGDYLAVLSDTDAAGGAGAGGAYGITFKDLTASGQENGAMQIGCAQGTLDNGGSGYAVTGGQDYYVIVKGNGASDSGNYSLAIDDMVSNQAQAGSTAIACAAASSSIDAVYPPGDYYAVVTGPSSGTSNGPYELQVKDVDAFLDYNREACDKDSGPNATSVIEANVAAGTHYVVVKGDGPSQTGTYQLNVRDMTARPDNRIACSDTADSNRIEADVKANTDYTVLLKGDAKDEQGTYNISLYDELSQQVGGGQLLSCQTICPNIAPYNSCRPLGDACSSNGQCCSGKCSSSKCSGTDPAGTQACRQSELTSSSFNTSLSADTYYLTVKGRKATEKPFYELQVGEVKKDVLGGLTGGNNNTDFSYGTSVKYAPPQWSTAASSPDDVKNLLASTGTKVLPVLSCAPGSNGGRCDGTAAQAKAISLASGAKDKNTGQGILRHINSDGTGIGSGLAMAVRDLANYLAMDITLSVVGNPGFTINIQKCTDPAKTSQAMCTSFSQNCNDPSEVPKNTIAQCTPGATPKFFVSFTNPVDPNAVKPNPSDPNGGYHFKLQLVGNSKFLLDEIPVYIIPTGDNAPTMGPPTGAGTFMASGTYEQSVFGAGCNYYNVEGEAPVLNSCGDGIDNNGDGKRDRGVAKNDDGDFDDDGEIPPDPGCVVGSCSDNINNDGDMKGGMQLQDMTDPDCIGNLTQDWTDLFFKADVPAGTSIVFDMCTGATPGDLTNCSLSRVATITGNGDQCSVNADCKGKNGARDGFCGKGGSCQFIDPPRIGVEDCTSDAQCPNADPGNGELYYSFCKTSVNKCQYIAPPADIANNLMKGQNGKPYIKVKVTLNADASKAKTPTLFDWYLQYQCRSGS